MTAPFMNIHQKLKDSSNYRSNVMKLVLRGVANKSLVALAFALRLIFVVSFNQW